MVSVVAVDSSKSFFNGSPSWRSVGEFSSATAKCAVFSLKLASRRESVESCTVSVVRASVESLNDSVECCRCWIGVKMVAIRFLHVFCRMALGCL